MCDVAHSSGRHRFRSANEHFRPKRSWTTIEARSMRQHALWRGSNFLFSPNEGLFSPPQLNCATSHNSWRAMCTPAQVGTRFVGLPKSDFASTPLPLSMDASIIWPTALEVVRSSSFRKANCATSHNWRSMCTSAQNREGSPRRRRLACVAPGYSFVPKYTWRGQSSNCATSHNGQMLNESAVSMCTREQVGSARVSLVPEHISFDGALAEEASASSLSAESLNMCTPDQEHLRQMQTVLRLSCRRFHRNSHLRRPVLGFKRMCGRVQSNMCFEPSGCVRPFKAMCTSAQPAIQKPKQSQTLTMRFSGGIHLNTLRIQRQQHSAIGRLVVVSFCLRQMGKKGKRA